MEQIDPKAIISVGLVLATLIGVGGDIYNRTKLGKGIGWQVVRFNTIMLALPLAGLLALNGALSEGVTAILAGALGYAFGKPSDERND